MSRSTLLLLFFLPSFLYAQEVHHYYVIGGTPTGKDTVIIDGLALGLIAQSASKTGYLKVRGLNIEILPLSFFTIIGGTVFTMINAGDPQYYPDSTRRVNADLHGLSLSGGLFEEVRMFGVSLNLINSYASEVKGVTISGGMNSNYRFNGVQSSLIGNRAVKGKGLQIGMFNSCQELHGVQIGFLNRCGRRVIPIINWNFPKKKSSQRWRDYFK